MISKVRNLFIVVREDSNIVFNFFFMSVFYVVEALLFVVEIGGLMHLQSSLNFGFEHFLQLYQQGICSNFLISLLILHNYVVVIPFHIGFQHLAHCVYILMTRELP